MDDNEKEQGGFISSVSCEVHVPLSWSNEADAPKPGEALYTQNTQRLHAIEALEANSLKKPDPNSVTDIELHHLETKLNLALELLGTLLEETRPRPAPASLLLDAMTASWSATEPPVTGERGRLSLYLHPLLAQPIIIPGQIISVATVQDTGPARVCCEFDPMPDDMADALAAYVFRGHRRAVAQKRLQPDSENADSNPTPD